MEALVIQVQLGVHYMHMEDEIKSSTHLETIVLSTSEFAKYTFNKKELLIDGRYFDIANTTMVGDIVHVTGIWDDKEAELKASLSFGIFDHSSHEVVRLFSFLLTPCIVAEAAIFDDILTIYIEKEEIIYCNNYLFDASAILLHPPATATIHIIS